MGKRQLARGQAVEHGQIPARRDPCHPTAQCQVIRYRLEARRRICNPLCNLPDRILSGRNRPYPFRERIAGWACSSDAARIAPGTRFGSGKNHPDGFVRRKVEHPTVHLESFPLAHRAGKYRKHRLFVWQVRPPWSYADLPWTEIFQFLRSPPVLVE